MYRLLLLPWVCFGYRTAGLPSVKYRMTVFGSFNSIYFNTKFINKSNLILIYFIIY